MVWKKIAAEAEIPSGKGKAFEIDGNKIAIFNQNGFHAIDDICVHQDGSLAPGNLDGYTIECPLHFWHYDIRTGELKDYLKDIKLRTYPVKIQENYIYVDV